MSTPTSNSKALLEEIARWIRTVRDDVFEHGNICGRTQRSGEDLLRRIDTVVMDSGSHETNPVARTLEDASRSSAFWKAETIAGNTVIRKLREALVHSVSVIQTWHNMGVPDKQASALWDLYWLNAPELKQIRDALAQEANELKASEGQS